MQGRRNRVRNVFSFALVALVGACGGSDGDAPEEFVREGNAICQKLADDFEQLGAPPALNTPARADWELRVQVLAQRAFTRLRRLEAPKDLRDERDAFVSDVELNRRHIQRLRVVSAQLERELRDGTTDGPAQQEFQDLTETIRVDQERTQARLRAIGWRNCALLASA
jgi:hypothetical protein